MKMGKWTVGAALAVAALTSLAASQTPPEVDSNGLHLVHDSELRLVYRLPNAELDGYSKVILVDAYVAFRKNWEKDHEHPSNSLFRMRPQDVEDLKQRVAVEFHKAFSKELEKKGYAVVAKDQTGPDVLIVRPAIINLDVVAPDTMRQAGMGGTLVSSAGAMTLYAELYDSMSSQLIVRVVDPEADREGGMARRADRVTNKAAMDRIVKQWAEVLAEHMHRAAQQ